MIEEIRNLPKLVALIRACLREENWLIANGSIEYNGDAVAAIVTAWSLLRLSPHAWPEPIGLYALQYARMLSPSVKGVYVELDPDKTRRLEEKWIKWGMGAPLVALSSPYRSLLHPFLEYLDHLLVIGDNHMVTIVVPEFVPAKWWQHLLHNQTALLIKGALLFRKNVVVTNVPYHLR